MRNREAVSGPGQETKPEGLDLLSEEERRLYPTLVAEYKKSAISMDEFRDLYGTGVDNDQRLVAKREQEFARQDKEMSFVAASQRRGELFEALMAEQIELSDWLGPDTITIPTSRYDDIQNGVDMIAEFLRDDAFQYLALSVDITSSASAVWKKMEKIRQLSIFFRTLTRAKYFKSDRANFRGEIHHIPKVILGADKNTIKEVAGLRYTIEHLRHVTQTPQTKERLHLTLRALASHRIQWLILSEILLQLATFEQRTRKAYEETFDQKIKSELLTIADTYKSALGLAKKIAAEKAKVLQLSAEDREKNEKDEVFQAIIAELKNL